MTTATTEQKNANDIYIDNVMNVVGNLCWAQDQGEKILKSWLDLGHVTREESKDMLGRMATQVKKNQEEMQKWVQSSVQMSMAAFRPVTATQLDELTKKVEDLTRKVETLSKSK